MTITDGLEDALIIRWSDTVFHSYGNAADGQDRVGSDELVDPVRFAARVKLRHSSWSQAADGMRELRMELILSRSELTVGVLLSLLQGC